jgi:predicted O-methyltransferase YrrM
MTEGIFNAVDMLYLVAHQRNLVKSLFWRDKNEHMLRLGLFYVTYLFRWIKFYLTARTKYDVHSPFVASFVHYVVEDERNFYIFPLIERMRARLLRNKMPLEIQDHGAGSKADRRLTRSVSSVVRHAAVSEATGQQLFRIVATYQPKNMVELGCSLGISGLYLAGATYDGHLYTLEGCPETAEMALLSFKRVEINNVSLRIGQFADLLPKVLAEIPRLDLVYFDGDHRPGATESYFNQCLEKAHEGSVFIFADIHWSGEMQAAWRKLRRHPQITFSADLFHLGVVFFNPEIKTPIHLSLIKAKYKPWRLGFFSDQRALLGEPQA